MSLQIDLLEQSFERVKPHSDDFSFSFYQNLLADYPQLRPLFAKTNMEQQQQKLMMSLVLVVENLRNPTYLKTILKNLGERHVSYHALREHYPMVGAALLKTFESYLGPDWTPEVKQAWTEAYGVLVSLMLEGAKYSEEVSQPEHTVQQKERPSVISSQQTSQSKIVSTPNTVKPVESSKAPTASVNSYAQETSKFEDVSKPNSVELAESSNVSTESTANTSILNLKLLLIISVIAGLLGVGFLYFHSNSKQDNGSATSFIIKNKMIY